MSKKFSRRTAVFSALIHMRPAMPVPEINSGQDFFSISKEGEVPPGNFYVPTLAFFVLTDVNI